MSSAASSEQTTSPREQIRATLSNIKIFQDYPEIHRVVLRWYEKDLQVEDLAELKHNGSGKQVVLKYPAHVFMDVIRYAIKVSGLRKEFDARTKSDVARVLMGTCLFNNNNLAVLLGVSRGTVVAWSPGRPENFPMQRLGGELTVESLHLILAWWEEMVQAPNLKANGWFLRRAAEQGMTWPVIARLTGQTVQQAKKASLEMIDKEGGDQVVINVNLEAGNQGNVARETIPSAEGHPVGGSESSPERDEPDEQGESLLRAPSSVAGDDAAFAPAVYLASDHEADDGDAGHADAPKDGLSEGDEGAVREGTGGTERGVHPFLLA
jgi:hypothetical protein